MWEDEARFLVYNILLQAQLANGGAGYVSDLAKYDIYKLSSGVAQALEISPLFLTFSDD